MAMYRCSVKSGKVGNAQDHLKYISRYGEEFQPRKRSDLIWEQHGNMPSWCNENPKEFFAAADKYERKNAAAYREFELALPIELSREAQIRALKKFTQSIAKNKPYFVAIHEPIGAIGGEKQPHAHLMLSDRTPDEFDRSKEQFFRRYNPTHPERGGCKKDSGGKHPVELSNQLRETRNTWAKLNNEELEKAGSPERVDHRSLRDQGIARKPEKYLGPTRVRKMDSTEKNKIQLERAHKKDIDQ